MSKIIIKKCSHCNEEFEARLKEHNRGNAKFCSRKCSTINRTGKKIAKKSNCACSTCKKEFYRSPSKQKNAKHGFFFCSRICKEEAQKINSPNVIKEIFPNHYGDRSYIKYRELVIRKLENIQCERCQYDNHPEILQVHHKDRNRDNNKIENLELLCPNCHNLEHFLSKDGMYNFRK